MKEFTHTLVLFLTVVIASDTELEDGVCVGIDITWFVEWTAKEAITVIAYMNRICLARQNGALDIIGTGAAAWHLDGVDDERDTAYIPIDKIITHSILFGVSPKVMRRFRQPLNGGRGAFFLW